MKNLIYLFLVLLLAACAGPQQQVPGVETVNYKAYFYPYAQLTAPRVYAYQDAYSHAREYYLIQARLEPADTVLEITQYDSVFVKKDYTKLKIGEQSLTTTEEHLFFASVDSNRTPVPRVYSQSAIDWLQPLAEDTVSFTQASKLDFGGIKMDILDRGNFEKVSQAVPGLPYQPGDLLLQTENEKWDYNRVLNGKQQTVFSHTTYWAKGAGMVAYKVPETDFGSKAKNFTLIKTMSVQEFEQLAGIKVD